MAKPGPRIVPIPALGPATPIGGRMPAGRVRIGEHSGVGRISVSISLFAPEPAISKFSVDYSGIVGSDGWKIMVCPTASRPMRVTAP